MACLKGTSLRSLEKKYWYKTEIKKYDANGKVYVKTAGTSQKPATYRAIALQIEVGAWQTTARRCKAIGMFLFSVTLIPLMFKAYRTKMTFLWTDKIILPVTRIKKYSEEELNNLTKDKKIQNSLDKNGIALLKIAYQKNEQRKEHRQRMKDNHIPQAIVDIYERFETALINCEHQDEPAINALADEKYAYWKHFDNKNLGHLKNELLFSAAEANYAPALVRLGELCEERVPFLWERLNSEAKGRFQALIYYSKAASQIVNDPNTPTIVKDAVTLATAKKNKLKSSQEVTVDFAEMAMKQGLNELGFEFLCLLAENGDNYAMFLKTRYQFDHQLLTEAKLLSAFSEVFSKATNDHGDDVTIKTGLAYTLVQLFDQSSEMSTKRQIIDNFYDLIHYGPSDDWIRMKHELNPPAQTDEARN